jgi:S-adenosylmethionine decarboxylase
VIGQGTQVAMDMYRCDEEVVYDKTKIQEILKDTMTRFALREDALYLNDKEDEDNFTFVVLYDGGHIFLHVFPDYGYAAADVFSQMDESSPEQVAIYIRKKFSPDQSKLTVLQRGDFGSIADMKPRRKKMVKPIRRAKNAGATLKKLVLKTTNTNN